VVWQLLGVVAWGLSPAPRFLIAALTGSALLLLLGEPARGRFLRAAILTLAFGLIWSLGPSGSRVSIMSHPGLIGAFAGLGALADFALHPARDPRLNVAGFGVPAFVFVVALTLIPIGHGWIVTQDAVLLLADRALGGLPSYAVADAFAAWPPLAAFAWVAYLTLPLEASLVLLVSIRRKRADMDSRRILLACAVAGLLGVVGYWLCPATGPRYAFSGFPVRPEGVALQAISVPPDFPRNAMPSLHFAWACILYRAARPVAWLRWTTLAWLIGIAVAALGFGEHYLIDLVVAVPFLGAVESALIRRWRWMLVTGAIATAWVIYLGRGGGLDPVVGWIAVAASLMIGVLALPRRVYGSPTLPEANA
jgi:PAP2 superfamily protein